MGAWALGMIFAEASPRRCAIEEAQRIAAALRRRVELCGVFVNAPMDDVVAAAREVGLTMLQLHGARSRERPGLRGGTGETFDWGLVRSRRSRVPLILSGGIEAGNAAAAVAAVRPYALDSASGTESAPGHKDIARMAALFAAARDADERREAQAVGQTAWT